MMQQKQPSTLFWSQDVSVLWKDLSSSSFFPLVEHTNNQRLNAATRLTLVLGTCVVLITGRWAGWIVIVATVGCIWLLHEHRFSSCSEPFGSNENNTPQTTLTMETTRTPDEKNPYGNFLPGDNMTRPPAPPAYIPEIKTEITKLYKDSMPSSIPNNEPKRNTSDKRDPRLYGDLSEQLALAQSERTHYTTASTNAPYGGNYDYIIGNPSAWKDQNWANP